MSKVSIVLSQVENGINSKDRGHHINKPYLFRQIDHMLHCMLDCIILDTNVL